MLPLSLYLAACSLGDFSYLLGDWEVRNGQGQLMGHSRFESRAQGCALIEHWRGIRGGEGTGLMYFDPQKKVWLRFYVAAGFLEDGIEGVRQSNGIQFRNAAMNFPYAQTPEGATVWEGDEARTMTRLAAPRSFTPSPDTVAACSAPEFRHFDFWLGDWTVTTQGKPAGKSRIERASKGCLLIENWTSAGGAEGLSFNFYDPQAKLWRQRWLMGAQSLRLDGNFARGQMRLTNPSNSIEWTPDANGALRQRWTANGKVVFDGVYRR